MFYYKQVNIFGKFVDIRFKSFTSMFPGNKGVATMDIFKNLVIFSQSFP